MDGRSMTEATVGRGTIEVVPPVYDSGDCLSSDGGCGLATFTRCRIAWGKFNALLPILTSSSFTVTSRGSVYCTIRTPRVPYYMQAKPSWTLTLSDLHRLQRNKQRVLMHGHQGWNVRHGLCHIYMIYVYIWVVYSFCLFCCLFIIVMTQFVALYKPCKPKPKLQLLCPPEIERHLTLCLPKYLNYFSWM